MADWVLKGLARGIRTTGWPARVEETPGVTPGRPGAVSRDDSPADVGVCPTHALEQSARGIAVDFGRCVHCQRCRGEGGVPWQDDFEWADWSTQSRGPLPASFRRSINVRYLDAGSCGGCMGEARLIDAPSYNLHRFGIFLTATPRDADVLLVAGPVTEAMRTPLRLTYEAMPEPRRVVVMGVCAINGGVFGQSYACVGGVDAVIPVDILVPGCPPPPLAIIHGLLLAAGRAEAASLERAP